MSSRNATTVDNNNDNDLQNNNVYVYKGGKVDKTERENIEVVRVDESISIIDDEAFFNCKELQTVSFSANQMIKKIGEYSFYQCYNLLSIDLRNTQIESIGIRAFFECVKLATVQFPDTIRKIGKECFSRCHQLKVVDLSLVNHLESIEGGTFFECTALKTINLPPTTSCIGYGSFYKCEALENVDLRATCVKEIREEAFYLCTNLQTINFPKTLKHIGLESFYCTNLKYLNLQETSIERIGDRAFKYCTNLTTVVGISTSHQEQRQESMDNYGSMILPASLVEIGEDAFDECPALQNCIDNNWLQFECDVNRGGRRFLQRDHRHHESHNDGDVKRRPKVYYSSLWPLILYRAIHEMELPTRRIRLDGHYLPVYTTYDNAMERRASVIFYLLVHGVVADLQSQAQSGNVQAT